MKNTYYDTFPSFQGAIDSKIEEINTSLREDLASLFSLNFQIIDTNDKTGIL